MLCEHVGGEALRPATTVQLLNLTFPLPTLPERLPGTGDSNSSYSAAIIWTAPSFLTPITSTTTITTTTTTTTTTVAYPPLPYASIHLAAATGRNESHVPDPDLNFPAVRERYISYEGWYAPLCVSPACSVSRSKAMSFLWYAEGNLV